MTIKLSKAELSVDEHDIEIVVTFSGKAVGASIATEAALFLARLEYMTQHPECVDEQVVPDQPKPEKKVAPASKPPPAPKAVPEVREEASTEQEPSTRVDTAQPESIPDEPKPEPEPQPEPKPTPKPPAKKTTDEPAEVAPLFDSVDPKYVVKGVLAKVGEEDAPPWVGLVLGKSRKKTASLLLVSGEIVEVALNRIIDVRKVKSSKADMDVADGAPAYAAYAANNGRQARWTDVWDALTRLEEAGETVTNRGTYVLNKQVIYEAVKRAPEVEGARPPVQEVPQAAEPAPDNGKPEPEPAAEPAVDTGMSFSAGWVVTYQEPGLDKEFAACVVDPNGEEVEVKDLLGATRLIPRKNIVDAFRFVAPDGRDIQDQLDAYAEMCARSGKKPSWTELVYAFIAARGANMADEREGAGVLTDDLLDLAHDTGEAG